MTAVRCLFGHRSCTTSFPVPEKMLLMLVLLMPGAVSAGWSVTFENPNPCALKGSTVEFRCSYNHTDGGTVKKTAWFKGEIQNDSWKRFNLSALPSYQNRSEYVGDQKNDCSLVIHDLQESDDGHYYFRFDTDMYGRRTKTSVFLTVAELRAEVSPDSVKPGDSVTLKCTTTKSCQLPSTVWFKDGRPVDKPVFQAQAEDAGSYVCAVKGQGAVRSDPVALDVQYPPLNVSVEVSDHLTEDGGVNLTCSSAANPAADSYTWYQVSNGSMVQVGSGPVLSLPSVEASHTELYFCQARNQLGENNSTVGKTNTVNRVVLLVGIGVKVAIILLLPLIIICARRLRRRSAADKEENSRDYENINAA